MAITFLTLNEVLEIHKDQIARYGGTDELLDSGSLLSAIAQASATFEGRLLHSDLFEMAAAYLFHLVQNHPFADGNKRVGVVAALVFLELNDVEVCLSEDELESLVLSVAQGQVDKTEIAEFFPRRTQ